MESGSFEESNATDVSSLTKNDHLPNVFRHLERLPVAKTNTWKCVAASEMLIVAHFKTAAKMFRHL